MAEVERWFAAWLKRHLYLHSRGDWPAPDGPEGWDFYRGWLAAFREKAVTPAEAKAASTRLQQGSPDYVVEHLPALLERVAIARAEATADAKPWRSPPPDDLPDAEWLARWDRLEGPERAEILAAVRAANPGLARWEGLLRPLCAEALKARSALQPNPS